MPKRMIYRGYEIDSEPHSNGEYGADRLGTIAARD